MRRSVRYDDDDQPSAGSATIASQACSTLDELAAEVEHTYTSGAWVELLDAGYEHDADPYRAWMPERIRRNFHGASIRRRDLALYTGLFAGDAVPAPGRQLRGWEHEALDQMAAHLVSLRFEVLDERPAVEEVPNDWGDPSSAGCGSVATAGRLRAWCESTAPAKGSSASTPMPWPGRLRPVPDEEW